MITYINVYTGEKAKNKSGFRKWSFPPWLKGRWVEYIKDKYSDSDKNVILMRKRRMR